MAQREVPNGTYRAPVDGTWIGYSVRGSGPVCALCPVPWGVGAHTWTTILQLSRFLTLVLIDPRGLGTSGPVHRREEYGIPVLADDVETVRRHAGFERWSILGQSAGGFTALEYALKYPGALQALIIVCSSPTGKFHRGTIRDPHHPRYGEIREAAERMKKSFNEETLRAYFRAVYVLDSQTERGKEEIDAVFASTRISMERYRYFASVELNRYDVTGRLGEISAPTLVVAGRHDVHVSPALSELIAAGIPGAQSVLMERSGHFPWLDEPERFQGLVRSFIGANAI